MKRLKFYEEDVLVVIYNIFAAMESETDDINLYLKKVGADKDFNANDLFDTIDNAIEICKKYNKKG